MRCCEPGKSPWFAMDLLAPARSAPRAFGQRPNSFRLFPKGSSVALRAQLEQQLRCAASRMLGRCAWVVRRTMKIAAIILVAALLAWWTVLTVYLVRLYRKRARRAKSKPMTADERAE